MEEQSTAQSAPAQSAPTPESNPSHPQHASWAANLVNELLATGVLIITGGRVAVGGYALDSNPIEHGNLIDKVG